MKTKQFLKTIIPIGLALLCSTALVIAQDVQDDRPNKLQPGRRSPDPELNENIEFCRRLMRDRNYEGASAFLELLYEKHPDHSLIINLLVQCYDKLQFYEKAGAIVRRQLKQEPNNLHLGLLDAEMLAKQGKFDEAAEAYQAAAAQVPISNIIRLDAVIQSMVAHNLNDAALVVIDSLRTETGKPRLFSIHRGTIFERKKRYDLATMEFYPTLKDTTALGLNAEKRVVALLGFVESAPSAESTLVAQPDLFSNARALKILSAHFLKSGEYDRAFNFAIQQDSLENLQGHTLLGYMHRCSERKLYSQTVRVGEYLLKQSETLELAPSAYFLYADALARLGRIGPAITTYDTIYATFSSDRDRARALYHIGDLYLNQLQDYEGALVYFDSVKFHYTNDQTYGEALLAIPSCYLRQGNLAQAREEFITLREKNLDRDRLEEVEYNLALILFFEQKVDSARTAFNKLLVDYPRGFYINDAVRLLFTIEQAQNATDALADFSKALLYEHRRMPDSSAVRLKVIAAREDAALADLALFKLAGIELSMADSAAAEGYLDTLIDRFPDSYYLPLGMKQKADILMADPDQTDMARDIYRRLLEEYPNYPFISEVRQRLRELELTAGSA